MAKCEIELNIDKLEEVRERFKKICEEEIEKRCGEIKMSQDKILKLMTDYKLEMKHDPETGDWIFNVSVSEKEKKS